MYENILDYLLWIRCISQHHRQPGITDSQLDDFIKQVKGEDPIWEITGNEKGFQLYPIYVVGKDFDDAILKARKSNKYYSGGRIYME